MTPVTCQLKTANPNKKRSPNRDASGPRLGIDALLAKAFRLRFVDESANQQGILKKQQKDGKI